MLQVIFALLIFQFSQSLIPKLNPFKLRLLDHNETSQNYLVRGDYPGTSKDHVAKMDTFTYDVWKTELIGLIEIETKKFVTDFYIVDITLLHTHGNDEPMVKAEKDFFEKFKDRGLFFHNEINGTRDNATLLTEEEREERLKTFDQWDVDKLPALMEYARKWLRTPYEKPVIVYWHCAGGVDRTGETSGSYNMQFRGWTMKECYAENTKVKGGRLMGTGNAYMMNWYCFWLEKYRNIKADCEIWY